MQFFKRLGLTNTYKISGVLPVWSFVVLEAWGFKTSGEKKKLKEKYPRKFSNEVTTNSIHYSVKGFTNKISGMLRTCSDY